MVDLFSDTVADFEILDSDTDRGHLTLSVAWTGATGAECVQDVKFPLKAAVCSRCEGHGKHDHPAFSNGITESEWADEWGEDEREGYLAGRYDVTCEACQGEKIVWEPDYTSAPGSIAEAAAHAHESAQAARDAEDREDAITRRHENGEW